MAVKVNSEWSNLFWAGTSPLREGAFLLCELKLRKGQSETQKSVALCSATNHEASSVLLWPGRPMLLWDELKGAEPTAAEGSYPDSVLCSGDATYGVPSPVQEKQGIS